MRGARAPCGDINRDDSNVTEHQTSGVAMEGDIALIGMACRFPRADSPEEFWQLLVNGVEAIDTLSTAELVKAGVDPALIADRHYVRKAPRLADIAGFDCEFFGVPPREAEILDPQHRLFLECAWEALERAGHAPEPPGQAVGVFAGCGMPGYLVTNLLPHRELISSVGAYALMLANDKDFLATRVAHKLGLTGPAYTVQTACSTGLAAVHLACQSLLSGECGMAIAGAVSLRVPQAAGYLYQPGMILSPDGHCRPFDAAAQGTIGGSGVGIVVLRPLADAVRDGDAILAVIKGTAVNNDGNDKIGYTAPSVSGQRAVISDALSIAGLAASQIGYLEAHGTATPLGDPVELRALAEVFPATDGTAPRLGSVKSNFGHLDTAAGIAGLIKAVLAIHHGIIPPNLHFRAPNREAGVAASLFHIPTTAERWPEDDGPRRAGVSSFGIGGTNVHVVLEQAPKLPPTAPAMPPFLLPLSARSVAALDDATTRLADHLKAREEIDLADVAHTLAVGRAGFRHRRFVVCHDRQQAIRALRAPVPAPGSTDATPSLAFMFPGQGSQRPGMAAALYAWAPVFREEIDHAAATLRSELPDLRDLLLSPTAADINQTALAQPALFSFCWALARQWIHWGVRPDCLIGHSLGELVAATVAEVMTFADALHLVVVRGRLMQASRPGAMLAVGLGEAELAAVLPDTLSLAAVNGPQACVVSGPTACVAAFADRLRETGLTATRLATSHAFHSDAMDEALVGLAEPMRTLTLGPPRIPFVSNITGNWISAKEATDPNYWIRQARQPVRFADGLTTLLTGNCTALLEVGPGQVLSGLARCHRARPASIPVASSTSRRADDDASACLAALGTLWASGARPLWSAVHPGPRRRLELPPYPFQHRRLWIDPPANDRTMDQPVRIADAAASPVGRTDRDAAGWFRAISWRRLPPLPSGAPPGPLLIFADDSPLSDAVLAQTGDATLVRAARGAREPGTHCIDPADEHEWRGLIAELVATGRAPATILYLWSLAGNEDACFHHLVALARALEAEARRRPLAVLVVTSGAQDVLGGEVTCPVAALVAGPARVIRCEMPWIVSRWVDIAEPIAGAAPLLIAEAADHAGDVTVAHRGAYRWAPAAEPVRLEDSVPPPLRERGVYLIAGGLGGIGLSLARDLARYCHARLILTGRSGLPPRESWSQLAIGDSRAARRLQRVIAVERDGGDVLALAADIADPAAMRAAFTAAESHFGPLNGVIHAAGIAGGSMIARSERQTLRQVLAAKLDGMRALAPLLSGRTLEFVALCSSVAGFIGEPGQIGYCAANAVLDAFAHQLRHDGVPVVSIDWSTWREVGMAVETSVPDDLKAWRAQSLASGITPEEGAEAFRRILASGLHQVVVAPPAANLPIQADRGSAAEPARATSPKAPPGPRHSRRDGPPQSSTPPTNDIQRGLVALWEELIGIEPIGTDDDFFALGGHSLLATRILAGIWHDFGVEMSLAEFFEHPTIALLADEITLRQIASYDSKAVEAALAELNAGD
jgi:acyl transferase domain-containing protein